MLKAGLHGDGRETGLARGLHTIRINYQCHERARALGYDARLPHGVEIPSLMAVQNNFLRHLRLFGDRGLAHKTLWSNASASLTRDIKIVAGAVSQASRTLSSSECMFQGFRKGGFARLCGRSSSAGWT
jgi:hypothetical protein